MLERDLQKQILEYLDTRPGKYWRINTGSLVVEGKNKSRFIRFGSPGMSDILGIHPKYGFVAIEVKVGRNKPTDLQIDFLRTVAKNGGLAIVAYKLEDVSDNL